MDEEVDSDDSLIKSKDANDPATDEEDYDNVEDNLHKLITNNGIGSELPTVIRIKTLGKIFAHGLEQIAPSSCRVTSASRACWWTCSARMWANSSLTAFRYKFK